MKFFRMLRSGSSGQTLDLEDVVYGPFKSIVELDAFATAKWPNSKRRFMVFDAELCDVKPTGKELPEDQKRPAGDEKNWDKTEHGWACKTCHHIIMEVKVAHPIWDGPFEGSGSGQCEYESVGYCPNCEVKPSFHGAPIRRPWR